MADRLPIPRAVEEISAEWLNLALGGSGRLESGSRITAVRPGPAAGGIAVSGLVSRLAVETESADSSVPDHFFVKLRNPDWGGDRRGFLQEVRFYRDHDVRTEFSVPRCYYADIDEESGDFVLLLEDLTGATPGHPLEGCDFEASELLMRKIGRLHRARWGGDELIAVGWEKEAHGPAQLEKWLARFRSEWSHFTNDRPYGIGDELLKAVARTSDEVFMESGVRLEFPPLTLVHNDLHVENLLFDDRGGVRQVWIFDWQESGLGHPARDFAYILAGDTAEAVRRKRGRELLRTYWSSLHEGGEIDYDFRRLLEDYDAAVRWQFLFQVLFLNQFDPGSDHDSRTLRLEWDRVAGAFAEDREISGR